MPKTEELMTGFESEAIEAGDVVISPPWSPYSISILGCDADMRYIVSQYMQEFLNKNQAQIMGDYIRQTGKKQEMMPVDYNTKKSLIHSHKIT